MTESYREFLDSWATEIESRAQRVRTLIGNRHWASDGHHKEFLIREFLARYLPSSFRVGHGFIRTHLPSSECSPEIDVLVTSPATHPLFFDEGGLQISPVQSLRAAIEVKSTFGSTELTQTLQRIARIRNLVHTERPSKDVWLGAVFYSAESTIRADSVISMIEKCYRNIYSADNALLRLPTSAIHQRALPVPTCICLSGEFVAFFRTVHDSTTTIQVDVFATKSLSFALAAIDLVSSVTEGHEPTALEMASDNFEIVRAETKTIALGGSE